MKLEDYRKKYGLLGQDLAEDLGISQATVSRLESGKQMAKMELAMEIERLTGYEVKAEDLPLSDTTRAAVRRLRQRMTSLESKQAG